MTLTPELPMKKRPFLLLEANNKVKLPGRLMWINVRKFVKESQVSCNISFIGNCEDSK
jgi:hypothetical protein